ncbi:hypothetical protein QBC42DRAFT_342685 [Cladorrhinum samala]|uniref:Heterokaryon incompatibility domain-containing protein n=1 Tax=Cladorrhinum samala TaxID=585594 RepID=A0AAV9I5Q7_9PEZI|nr:hypothetical protein QBC42DRAFT_342685 [Cladorrhinum samala]
MSTQPPHPEPYHFHFITTNEKFEHTPLRSNSHIRTMMLHSCLDRDSDDDEPLRATFVEDAITTARYRVLCPVPEPPQTPESSPSNNPPTPTIDTPEGALPVSPALYAALLASRRMSTSDLCLWTPSLCIDFSNPLEASPYQQAGRLKTIYRSAEEVIAYLGTDDPSTVDAHEMLFLLSRLSLPWLLRLSTAPVTAEAVGEFFLATGLPPMNGPEWLALDRFMARPWFRSLHALPACLWAKKLRFMGAGWSLPADEFIAAFFKSTLIPWPMFGIGGYSEGMQAGVKCMLFLSRVRTISMEAEDAEGWGFPFVELLRQCRYAESRSTEERLAVLFATSIHGDDLEKILDDDSDRNSDLGTDIRIFRHLFERTTEGTALLSEARGHNPVAIAADTTPNTRTSHPPSWLPLLIKPPRETPPLRSDFRAGIHTHHPPLNPFIIPTNFSHHRTLLTNCTPLPCSCPSHNLIAATSSFPPRRQETPKPNQQTLSGITSLIAHWYDAQSMLRVFINSETQKPLTHYSDSNQPVLEALWQIFRFGRRVVEDGEDSSQSQWSSSLASAKVVFMLLLREDMRHVVEAHSENARGAMERMADEMEGWRFAATVTGYMGLFHEDVKEGDEVWVVEGAKVPLLLRKTVGGAEGNKSGGPGEIDDPQVANTEMEGEMEAVDETDGTDAKDACRRDITPAILEVPAASMSREEDGLDNGRWTKKDTKTSVAEVVVWEYEIVVPNKCVILGCPVAVINSNEAILRTEGVLWGPVEGAEPGVRATTSHMPVALLKRRRLLSECGKWIPATAHRYPLLLLGRDVQSRMGVLQVVDGVLSQYLPVGDATYPVDTSILNHLESPATPIEAIAVYVAHIDSLGYLADVGYNAPRVDADNSKAFCRGVLVNCIQIIVQHVVTQSLELLSNWCPPIDSAIVVLTPVLMFTEFYFTNAVAAAYSEARGYDGTDYKAVRMVDNKHGIACVRN